MFFDEIKIGGNKQHTICPVHSLGSLVRAGYVVVGFHQDDGLESVSSASSWKGTLRHPFFRGECCSFAGEVRLRSSALLDELAYGFLSSCDDL